jgi:hypothetical protein
MRPENGRLTSTYAVSEGDEHPYPTRIGPPVGYSSLTRIGRCSRRVECAKRSHERTVGVRYWSGRCIGDGRLWARGTSCCRRGR